MEITLILVDYGYRKMPDQFFTSFWEYLIRVLSIVPRRRRRRFGASIYDHDGKK
jgi:hypothetical protein